MNGYRIVDLSLPLQDGGGFLKIHRAGGAWVRAVALVKDTGVAP